jgi:hypothetical protein
MRGVNRVMLIGNLGKDPELQQLEGNISVAKFPLATTETFKDRGGKAGKPDRMAHRSPMAWIGRFGCKVFAQRKFSLYRRKIKNPQLG